MVEAFPELAVAFAVLPCIATCLNVAQPCLCIRAYALRDLADSESSVCMLYCARHMQHAAADQHHKCFSAGTNLSNDKHMHDVSKCADNRSLAPAA